MAHSITNLTDSKKLVVLEVDPRNFKIHIIIRNVINPRWQSAGHDPDDALPGVDIITESLRLINGLSTWTHAQFLNTYKNTHKINKKINQSQNMNNQIHWFHLQVPTLYNQHGKRNRKSFHFDHKLDCIWQSHRNSLRCNGQLQNYITTTNIIMLLKPL